MGNKQTLSSLAVVHEQLSTGRISLNHERGDNTIQELDNVLENATDIATEVQAFMKIASTKEVKTLAQIAVLLSTEFVGKQPATLVTSPNVVRACKMKAVAAVYRLISVPSVARLAVEQCIPALVNGMDTAEGPLLSLIVTCLTGMVFSVDEDAHRVSTCFCLEKCGFYDKVARLYSNVASASSSSTTAAAAAAAYYALVVASEHLVWVMSDAFLAQASSSGAAAHCKAMQGRVASSLWKTPYALFELSRHDDRAVRFAAMAVFVQSMAQLDAKDCAGIQESARNQGVVLWTLCYVAELSFEAVSFERTALPTPSPAPSCSIAQVVVASSGSSSSSTGSGSKGGVGSGNDGAGGGGGGDDDDDDDDDTQPKLESQSDVDEKVETPDAASAVNARERWTWPHEPRPAEGVEFGATEAQKAVQQHAEATNAVELSTGAVVEAAKLLLTVLCVGDKANEFVVFRALPESFTTFLASRTHTGPDLLVAQMTERSAQEKSSGSSGGGFGGGAGALARASFLRAGPSAPQPLKRLLTQTALKAPPTTVYELDAPALMSAANAAALSALLHQGGASARSAHAAKMNAPTERSSWNLLTAAICAELESSRAVWNAATLECAVRGLQHACREWDRQRVGRSASWDPLSLDVRYPMYSTLRYLCVKNVFVPQLIGESLLSAGSAVGVDPHGSLWALLDRAGVEAGRICAEVMRRHTDARSDDDGRGCQWGADSDDGLVHAYGDVRVLLMCLKASLLLVARYYPSLRRTVPIYALSDMLRRAVACVCSLHAALTADGVASRGCDAHDCSAVALLPSKDVRGRAGPSTTESAALRSQLNDLAWWASAVMRLLHLRLPDCGARDDWMDFVTAGGADALCVVLSTPLFAERPTPSRASKASLMDDVRGDFLLMRVATERPGDASEIMDGSGGTALIGADALTTDLAPVSVSAARLLQRLVFSSGVHAQTFATPEGLEFLASAMWQLATAVRQGAQDLATTQATLGALVGAAQKALDVSKVGLAGDEVRRRLAREKRALLAWVLVGCACACNGDAWDDDDDGDGDGKECNEEGGGTTAGAMSESAAQLLKDLLQAVQQDRDRVADRERENASSSPTSPGPSSLSVLLPPQLLRLCRALSPAAFAAIFNVARPLVSPEVLWGPALRRQCLRNAAADLAAWADGATHRHYPVAAPQPAALPSAWPPPALATQRPAGRASFASVASYEGSNGSTGNVGSRYPSLALESQVNGVYLRLMLDAGPEDFQVSLEPRVFAYAVRRELAAADQAVRMRLRLRGSGAPAAQTYDNEADAAAADRNAMLLQMAASRLLQRWPLPEDVWCTVLAPQLTANLANCVLLLQSTTPGDANRSESVAKDGSSLLLFRVTASAVSALARSLDCLLGVSRATAHTFCDQSDSDDSDVADSDEDDDQDEDLGQDQTEDGNEGRGDDETEVVASTAVAGEAAAAAAAASAALAVSDDGHDNAHGEEGDKKGVGRPRCDSVASYSASVSMSVSLSVACEPRLPPDQPRSVGRGPGQLLKLTATSLAALLAHAVATLTVLKGCAGEGEARSDGGVAVALALEATTSLVACVALRLAEGAHRDRVRRGRHGVTSSLQHHHRHQHRHDAAAPPRPLGDDVLSQRGDEEYKRTSSSFVGVATPSKSGVGDAPPTGGGPRKSLAMGLRRLSSPFAATSRSFFASTFGGTQGRGDNDRNSPEQSPSSSPPASPSWRKGFSASAAATGPLSVVPALASGTGRHPHRSSPSRTPGQSLDAREVALAHAAVFHPAPGTDADLLVALASCCRASVACRVPRATLSALAALHLLASLDGDASQDEAAEGLPAAAAPAAPPPPVGIVNVLCARGLPSLLLETVFVCLERARDQDREAADDEATEVKTGDASDVLGASDGEANEAVTVAEGVPLPLTPSTTKWARWAYHPLFNTNQFIKAHSHSHGNGRDIDVPRAPPLSSTLASVVEDVEEALKAEFRTPAPAVASPANGSGPGVTATSATGSLLYGAVARECVELLRLLCIHPAPDSDAASPATFTAAAAGGAGVSTPSRTAPVFVAGGRGSPSSHKHPLLLSAVSVAGLNNGVGPVLEHLLTAPMVFVMMTDTPLFLSLLSTPVPVFRPLAIWSPAMRSAAHAAAAEMNGPPADNIAAAVDGTTKSATLATTAGSPVKGAVAGGIGLHRHLAGECLVDNVYVRLLLPPDGAHKHETTEATATSDARHEDIGARDVARFVERLQSSVISSQRVIQHLQAKAAAGSTPTSSPAAGQLAALRAQLALKERALAALLREHHELGYNNLSYDEDDL